MDIFINKQALSTSYKKKLLYVEWICFLSKHVNLRKYVSYIFGHSNSSALGRTSTYFLLTFTRLLTRVFGISTRNFDTT